MRMSTRRKLALAVIETEERAIEFLATLPHKVAATTAVKAAVELTGAWEIERREMIRRDDPRPVYDLTRHELTSLYSLAANYCQEPEWDVCPADKLRHFLTCLPPDAAAFKAHQVVRWARQRLL
jgi:hypothetical protein